MLVPTKTNIKKYMPLMTFLMFLCAVAHSGISVFSNVVRVLKHGKAIPDSRCTLLGIDNFLSSLKTLSAVERLASPYKRDRIYSIFVAADSKTRILNN